MLASSHAHILRFLCTCLYLCILASLYPYVRVYLLVSPHSYIFISSGSRVLACNLVSSHPLTLRLMYSVSLLVSSHPHILTSLGSCSPGACWHPHILTSSYPQVHVLWMFVDILASSHPYIITFMFSGCLLVSSHPHILISLGSCTLGACCHPRILTSSYHYVHVLRELVGILTSSYSQVPVFVLVQEVEIKSMVLTKKTALMETNND